MVRSEHAVYYLACCKVVDKDLFGTVHDIHMQSYNGTNELIRVNIVVMLTWTYI